MKIKNGTIVKIHEFKGIETEEQGVIQGKRNKKYLVSNMNQPFYGTFSGFLHPSEFTIIKNNPKLFKSK